MVEIPHATQSQPSAVVECSWCTEAAVVEYTNRRTGETFPFCADCDPVNPSEPDACSEHKAGCGRQHDTAVA
jgi:hypothetical protein